MTTIDLPADIVWPTPTLGVAIVQDDEQWASEVPDATVEFVAPRAWAQYDKPCDRCEVKAFKQRGGRCENCKGTGKVERPSIRFMQGDRSATKQIDCPSCSTVLEMCPDCRDGRQVWTVRWPCPHSYVDRWGKRHDALHADGYLSARATIQVVPVVVSEDCVESQHENRPHLCVVGGRAIFFDGEHDVAELFLDPLPTPGRDFAVIVRLT